MKRDMTIIVRKICAGFFVAILLAMGIACGGGGGGSSAVVWPTLPEGILHLNANGISGYTGSNYVEVTPALDEFPEGTIWPLGVLIWTGCYAESGFMFVIEPDNPEEEITRFSIAYHPRGLNWTQSTMDFINEDPANRFLIFSIMAGLVDEDGPGDGNTIGGEAYITAGGYYQSEMKESAQELVDNFYSLIPFPYNLLITKEQFQAYLSEQIYNSTYVGGTRVTFSELAAMFLEPQNWERLDFKVTTEYIRAFSDLMIDRVAVSGLTYDTNSIKINNRIYRGDGNNSTGYRITGFPEEIVGRQFIRTQFGDAGGTENPFLTFNLTRASTLYMVVDPANTGLITYLTGDGWTLWDGETITVARPSAPSDTITFNLYSKEYGDGEEYPLAISLPGNGDATKEMYFVIADAGTFPYGQDVIVSAHTTLMENVPADVAAYQPAIKKEGGIVVNENGIEEDGAQIEAEPVDLVHADFVENFDANVFVNTEGGSYELQKALADVSNIEFVEHIITNNGFRLIDTYNDRYPAFGGDSQVLQVENMLGISLDALGSPISIPLSDQTLFTFANMNLLNSPNLVGLYLKSITTDDAGLTIWNNGVDDKGFNFTAVRNYIRDHAVSYTYFLSSTGEEISLVDLLKTIGNREEGETTFRVLIELPEGKTCEIAGGLFVQDYFTNVYDAVIGGAVPLEVFTGEGK